MEVAEPRNEALGAPEEVAHTLLTLRDFVDTIPAGAVVVDSNGTIRVVNRELCHQFGYDQASDLVGLSIETLVPMGQRAKHSIQRQHPQARENSRLMGEGRPLFGQKRDGSRFMVEVGLRSFALDAGLTLAIVSDRSDRMRTADLEASEKVLMRELGHQEIVAREMGHRVKNLLATMTALISLSARGARTPKEMEEKLRGRVVAMSSVIDLAFKTTPSDSTHGALSLDEIVRAVLAPFWEIGNETSRFTVSGPGLIVGERPAEVLALVFHELATNAMKYGSLRQAGGKLTIDWRIIDPSLELSWEEQSIEPDVSTTTSSKGYGTVLVSRLVEGELEGSVTRDVTRLGWTTRLSIPIASLVRDREAPLVSHSNAAFG